MNDAATTVLETRKHVKGDRDFLFGFLRDMAQAVRWVIENPDDRAAVLEFTRQLSALLAFAEERNVPAGGRVQDKTNRQ